MFERIKRWFRLCAQRRYSLQVLSRWPNVHIERNNGGHHCLNCREMLVLLYIRKERRSLAGETFSERDKNLAHACLRCMSVYPHLEWDYNNATSVDDWFPGMETDDTGHRFVLPSDPHPPVHQAMPYR